MSCVSSSVFFAPLGRLIGDLLSECYNAKRTKTIHGTITPKDLSHDHASFLVGRILLTVVNVEAALRIVRIAQLYRTLRLAEGAGVNDMMRHNGSSKCSSVSPNAFAALLLPFVMHHPLLCLHRACQSSVA